VAARAAYSIEFCRFFFKR